MRTTGRYIEDLRTRLAECKRENKALRRGWQALGITNPEALGELMECIVQYQRARSGIGDFPHDLEKRVFRSAARVRGEVGDE